jgi:hypothetical protein
MSETAMSNKISLSESVENAVCKLMVGNGLTAFDMLKKN